MDALGLRYGQTKAPEERVIKNGWPADVFGRALCFSDLGILEVASIERHVEPYGAVLVLTEEEAGSLGFGYTESFEREATAGQRETLKRVADTEGDSLPDRLLRRAESELPALFLASMAVVKGAVYFRENGYGSRYESVLDYWSHTMRAAEDQAHRDFNAGIRSHLDDIGFDLSEVPRPQLDDQRREEMRDDIAPEINELYAHAQMLSRPELPTAQFVIQTARHALTARSK